VDADSYELLIIECCWLCAKCNQERGWWFCEDGNPVSPLGWCEEYEEIEFNG